MTHPTEHSKKEETPRELAVRIRQYGVGGIAQCERAASVLESQAAEIDFLIRAVRALMAGALRYVGYQCADCDAQIVEGGSLCKKTGKFHTCPKIGAANKPAAGPCGCAADYCMKTGPLGAALAVQVTCRRHINSDGDVYIHGPGTFPHSEGCRCERCSPPKAKAPAGPFYDTPIEHPDYCHEHGGHLVGSPACELARERASKKASCEPCKHGNAHGQCQHCLNAL